MGKQRCLICNTIKDTNQFFDTKKGICTYCSGGKTTLALQSENRNIQTKGSNRIKAETARSDIQKQSASEKYQCTNCLRTVSSVNKAGICKSCAYLNRNSNRLVNKKGTSAEDKTHSVKKRFPSRINKVKKDIIRIIVDLIEEMNVSTVIGFEETDLSEVTSKQLYNDYLLEELVILLSALEYQYNIEYNVQIRKKR